MRPYYERDGITIYNGDSREVLSDLKESGVVVTDPPYSTGRQESEFAGTGNVAVCLDYASKLVAKDAAMLVFGTSSGRGLEFIKSAIRTPLSRILVWHKKMSNSLAAGPWRWDVVLIYVFGRGCFGRPEHSSVFTTGSIKSLAIDTGHRAPIPTDVFQWLIFPFDEGLTVIDPFCGVGGSLLAAQSLQRKAVGIELSEEYCEIAAKRLDSVSGGLFS